MQELVGRVPPNSLDAERSVLGAMLIDPQAVSLAVETLKKEDFYAQSHQEIYDAMYALHAARRPVDLVTLCEELTRRGSMDGVGGIAYLSDLSGYVPSTANVQSYITIAEDKSTLRKLARAGGEIAQKSYDAREETIAVLEFAEKAIYDIAMKRGGPQLEPLEPVLQKVYAHIEELARNRGVIMGVPTGFTDLDGLTTGFHPGELVILAARPSVGKSALAINMAQHAAVHAGKKIALFSLEMPRESIVMRMMCSEARVDGQQVRKGMVSDEDWEKLAFALSSLAPAQVFIDETSSINVLEMRSKCRRLQVEQGLDMIIIDYLQLMSAVKPAASRQLEVSEISRALKALAVELKVPVLALSQLSRAPMQRADHKPQLSDLRDSGAIEQDADVVMFIHRPRDMEGEEAEAMRGLAQVILAKQRNGPTADITLGYIEKYTLFTNYGGAAHIHGEG